MTENVDFRIANLKFNFSELCNCRIVLQILLKEALGLQKCTIEQCARVNQTPSYITYRISGYAFLYIYFYMIYLFEFF